MPAILALAAAIVGYAFRRNALDDPFVTYRYADNLLAGLGPVYNPGERIQSTTALGYAYLLAAGHAATPWLALPRLSNALSAAALCALALALYGLGARNGRPWVGASAGALTITSPLLASTFGLETCLLLGLVGWSALAWDAGRWKTAALIAAAATLVRADGALAMVVLAGAAAVHSRRIAPAPLALYAAVVVPYLVLVWGFYGSATPTTLAAKVAQATIAGWPGYAEGLRRLVAEWLALTPLFWVGVPLILLGATMLPRHPWALPLVAWAVAQAVSYQLIGVASYTWYYAPLVPAAALLASLGAARLVGSPSPLVAVPIAPLAVAQVIVLAALLRGTPEPRAVAYESVGRWLDANTAPSDRVAVMEVGITGYYARRPMVDLLGLIRPESIAALARQDLFWTIAEYEPEVVVLTARNPLWFQFAEPDHWFFQRYAPVGSFEQPGFWGSPLTAYRRRAPPRQAPEADLSPQLRFGNALALDRVVVERLTARPGQYLTVQLFWRATERVDREYAAFVHVVSAEPKVVAQHDTPIVATRWPAGAEAHYYHPMLLPADTQPGRYSVEVGIYLPEEPLTRLPPSRSHPRNVAHVADITVGP